MATRERPVILGVDDEPGILESFGLIFEPDHEVVSAPDGSVAMAILQSRPVDLILLDLGLPEVKRGLALLAEIRAVDAKVPVIVVSITDRARTTLAALRLGANDFVTKPFEEDDLLLRVRGLLSELRLRPPRILLIEPDVGVRAAITVALERECLVSAVRSPALAASELRGSIPDLVVLSRAAGAGDDTGLLANLRRQSRDLPVIFMTTDFHAVLAGIAAHLPAAPGLPSVQRFGRRTTSLIQRIAGAYATISVNTLAEGLGLSTTQVSRAFSTEVGMALKTFIMRVRVHAALCLVRETDEKLDEIASRAGLYDGPNLCRTLARHGLGPPSGYR